ncbi:hypothetical protein [Novosphingobium sp. ST904]|uniref:hypothetical protein n=1 Tax=Novosphingobium sp. ST904 TaxID=1684385 RepID=UPI0006C8A950|nr:hypothetical protein [Novosphingobium sp. ST904]KPH67080.1 hypothetical protein ADT71_02995 [Novosphingobium sp. ST904]TCM25146.1 hypothetical protein EDF59_1448 [Novosphingobium sp. ST904]
MTDIDTDKLRALDKAATPGPWERDSEYDGDGLATSSDGCATGWHNFFVGADVDGKWRTLLDTVNSDHKLIEDDRDENGGHSWDAIGEANTALIVHLRNSVPAILAMAEDWKRCENHRNNLADKITDQSVEIGALKAEVAHLCKALERSARIAEIALRALGKEPKA